jgi:hypothetical protein
MTPKPITKNTLFYGDNLPILREYIPDESVDLIYLDPPFNSNRSYNVLFKDESGHAKSGDVRDLKGVLECENAVLGVFVTLEPPTKEMETEAVTAGYYHSPGWNLDYRHIQTLTIEDLLKGAQVQMPPTAQTFPGLATRPAHGTRVRGRRPGPCKQAPKVGIPREGQAALNL